MIVHKFFPLLFLFFCTCLPLHLSEAAETHLQAQAGTKKEAQAKNSKAAPAAEKEGEGVFTGFTSALGGKGTALPGKTPEEKLDMLSALLKQGKNLRQDVSMVQDAMERNPEAADKTEFVDRINALNQQLNESSRDFERIATGVELSTFEPQSQKKPFNWKDEFSALLDPMIKEMRDLTAPTKQKADLRDQIETLSKQVQTASQAVENLKILGKASQDEAMVRQLETLQETWNGEQARLSGKLELAEMELHTLSTQSGSLFEKVRDSLSRFFKTRGLYLFLALLAFALTFFLLRYLINLLLRHLPKDKHGRPHMYARLITIFAHFASILLAMAALLAVFYIVADWFMISLVVLIFIGILWAVRQTLPAQWQQSLLMLNMGPVREGERLVLDGVPWRVDSLGVFCRISNPALDQVRRIPVEQMLKLISRPYDLEEPWFPCKKGDFIKLGADNVVQVVSLSHEQVEVLRAGMATIYPTADFLRMAAANMNRKFSVSTTLPLSYDLQAEATGTIPETLRSYLQKRLDEEGYSSKCLSVTCEFAQANTSSLDIAVILDFEGDMAGLFYRLRRALQRWCVDCCTENKWDIPYNQIVVHTAAQAQ